MLLWVIEMGGIGAGISATLRLSRDLGGEATGRAAAVVRAAPAVRFAWALSADASGAPARCVLVRRPFHARPPVLQIASRMVLIITGSASESRIRPLRISALAACTSDRATASCHETD